MENFLMFTGAWVLALILAVAMAAAWGLGYWLGAGLRARYGEQKESKFENTSLAFVGLLLAFTFGMSLSKHDNRRDMVVADSNSIGDFYTCAGTLREPVRTKLQTVIREYLVLRVELARKPVDLAALEEFVRRSQQMQAQMTDLTAQAINEGTPVAVSLINTLNALTSAQADGQRRSRRKYSLHPARNVGCLRHAGPQSAANRNGHREPGTAPAAIVVHAEMRRSDGPPLAWKPKFARSASPRAHW
jgi:hypothetical protein